MVTVDVYAIAAYLGRPVGQVDWFDPKVGSRPALVCIYQMNQ